MIFQRTLRGSKRSGATAAGMCGLAAGAVLLLCGAGSVPVENFTPQGAMQADLNAGGHNGTNFGTVQATNIASGTVSASAGVTGAISYIVYAGFHGTDNALQLAGSRDGKNFDRMETRFFGAPTRDNMRDDNILTQPNDPYRRALKIGGWYYLAQTSGTFGLCSYFAIYRSHDLKNWYWVENVPVTSAGSVAATTTLTTTSGSATATLPGTAISGLTNGTFYTIGGAGAANVPAGAGFTYNSSSATQTLLQYSGGSSVNATGSGTAAAISLTFINNVWSPDWYTPDGVNFYILFQVSTQPGNNYGTPGIGYMPITNVSAWQSGTAPAFGNYVNLGLPSGANGPFGPMLVGSTYYLFFDNGGNCHYATSSSPLSGYSDQGVVAAHLTTDAGGDVESAQMMQISPTLWRFYFAKTSTGLVYYSEASAIAGATWSTAQQIVIMDGNGGLAAGCPVTLTNYDDIFNALAAQASAPYYSEDNGYSIWSFPDSRLLFYTGNVNTGDGNASGNLAFTISQYGNNSAVNLTSAGLTDSTSGHTNAIVHFDASGNLVPYTLVSGDIPNNAANTSGSAGSVALSGVTGLGSGVATALTNAVNGAGGVPTIAATTCTLTSNAVTVNLALGDYFVIPMSSATGTVTVTFSNAAAGSACTLEMVQGATAYNATFPTNTIQAGGGGTTYTASGASATDLISVVFKDSTHARMAVTGGYQ